MPKRPGSETRGTFQLPPGFNGGKLAPPPDIGTSGLIFIFLYSKPARLLRLHAGVLQDAGRNCRLSRDVVIVLNFQLRWIGHALVGIRTDIKKTFGGVREELLAGTAPRNNPDQSVI